MARFLWGKGGTHHTASHIVNSTSQAENKSLPHCCVNVMDVTESWLAAILVHNGFQRNCFGNFNLKPILVSLQLYLILGHADVLLYEPYCEVVESKDLA